MSTRNLHFLILGLGILLTFSPLQRSSAGVIAVDEIDHLEPMFGPPFLTNCDPEIGRTAPLDVNHDGLVSPLDALLIVNEINDRKSSDPETGEFFPAAPCPARNLDVSGNSRVSEVDALLVLEYLDVVAVPEPNALALAIMGFVPWLTYRRRDAFVRRPLPPRACRTRRQGTHMLPNNVGKP